MTNLILLLPITVLALSTIVSASQNIGMRRQIRMLELELAQSERIRITQAEYCIHNHRSLSPKDVNNNGV